MINAVGNTRVNDGSQPVANSSPAAFPVGKAASAGTVTPDVTDTPEVTGGNQAADTSTVHAAVTKLNVHAQNLRRTLSFSVDDTTGRTIIRVYDAETQELIREIPPDETIRMAQEIDRYNSSHLLRGQQA